MRPRFVDANSGLSILLDTGAQVSLWPRRSFRDAIYDPSKKLQAVNGTRISTYGHRNVTIRHPKTQIPYIHSVLLADINQPILGWPFLVQYKLDMKWHRGKCMLVDKDRNQTIPLKMSAVESQNLDLAVITFKQYSQQQSEIQSKAEIKEPIPSQYQEILDQFPETQKIDFQLNPRHGVLHEIETGNAKPCRSTVRPLLPGSKKAIEVEKTWREMEKLGIVKKVESGEPTHWSSAMHIAKKADGTLRPVGDYRALNDLTTHDSYPLPCLKSVAPKLNKAKYFSKIDLFRAYYLIPLSLQAQTKTCVLTPFGAYKYTRLPMGLKNSGQSFQRLMDNVLDGVSNQFCYLDLSHIDMLFCFRIPCI